MKLRVNGILNGMEKRGLLYANTTAAGGIILNIISSLMY